MPSLFPPPARPIPNFQSLLVVGNYHVSAPIYMALSHAQENLESRPLILSPSRQSLKDSLKSFNDNWLAVNARCGDLAEMVSCVDMLYSPTLVHLTLILSMLRPAPSNRDEIPTSCISSKATRIIAPDLIVLHEPSRYFTLDPDLSSYTVSSYLSLIAQAFEVVKIFSVPRRTPRLVVFDSQLEKLKLPIVKPLLPEGHVDGPWPKSEAVEPLLKFVEPFFDSIALFEDVEVEEVIPSSQGDDMIMDEAEVHPTSRRAVFFRSGEKDPIDTFQWLEITRNGVMNFEIPRTEFHVD